LTSLDAPCAKARRIADERCGAARRLRESAATAADEHRRVQREHEVALARIADATARADPDAVRGAKDAAQGAFRRSTSGAASTPEIEDATAVWLDAINAINGQLREARAVLARERGNAAELEALLAKARDAAATSRMAAESAARGCQDARESLAACEEQHVRERTHARVAAGSADDSSEMRTEADVEASPWRPRGDAERSAELVIDRVLGGDRAALVEVSSAIADASEERRRSQLLIADLVDGIVSRALDEAYLDLPPDQPFWSELSAADGRRTVAALASLGSRFDGRSGFAGDHVPSLRDLSLAVAYAGLDPKRVRRWPTPDELSRLFVGATVAAHEYLSERAPELTLAQLVDLLGTRAEPLAELWDRWGRARPALLAPASTPPEPARDE
jgi:hypothetical protein